MVAPVLVAWKEPRLSVQQYASLRAECVATPPERLREVRARFGLDEAMDEAETAAWGRKFAQDTALFQTYKRLFQAFRSTASVAPSTMASRSPSKPVMSTAALTRVLSLGEHATMAAELLVLPEEEVYAKHDLADRGVRAEVLRACEQRLQDPSVMETWKKLHAIAVAKQGK
jgi:hypothetical protein